MLLTQPEQLVVEEATLFPGPGVFKQRKSKIEGAKGMAAQQQGGALSARQSKVLLEEVCGHGSVAVGVGVTLLPGGLPGVRIAVRSPRQEPDVLLALDLAVGLRGSQMVPIIVLEKVPSEGS